MTLQDSITSLKAILLRNDCTDALATQFIQMAQTRIERVLRVPGQETIGTITGNATAPTDSIVIPNDFLALKYMYTEGGAGMDLMEFKDVASYFKVAKRHGLGGVHPRWYTRVGGSYLITPALPSTGVIYMVYYASQPQLLNPSDSNFFTISAQDILVYGALSFACDYFVDDRAGAFEQRFVQLINDLMEQARETDWSQSDMAIEPAYQDY